MVSLITWAAGDSASRKNFEKTVMTKVNFEQHRDKIPDDAYEKLLELFPDGEASFWGTAPGKRNNPTFRKVRQGDLGIFYGRKEFYGQATVAMTFTSRDLALENWGANSAGTTWELLHALTDVKRIKIPIDDFNAAGVLPTPRKEIRGYSVYSDSNGTLYLTAFDGVTETGKNDGPTNAELEKVRRQKRVASAKRRMADLKKQRVIVTDRTVTSTVRVEQPYLRSILLEGKDAGQCALCGETYPASFLVAAHIKLRQVADDIERLDEEAHIAMLACTLGCDQLYELGYISVNDEAEVITALLDDELTGGYLENYINDLAGRPFGMDFDGRRDYFAWHRDNTFLGLNPDR